MLRTGAALAALIVISGCAAGIKGRADPPDHIVEATNESVYGDQIRNALAVAGAAEQAYCSYVPYACGDPQKAEGAEARIPTPGNQDPLRYHRNTYLYEMMRAHELALQDYGRALSVEGRGGSFFTYLLNLGVITAAGVSKVQETARVLNVLGTGIRGISAGYDETVLLKQTLPALLDQMEAAQSTERTRIIERMEQDAITYPLSAARHDIARLGEAATLDVAVTALVAQAKEQKTEAVEEEAEAREIKQCSSEFTARLKAWFAPDDDEVLKKRITEATTFFRDNGDTVPDRDVVEFYEDCRHAALQKAFVKKFKVPEVSK